jgi:hypothetical protein
MGQAILAGIPLAILIGLLGGILHLVFDPETAGGPYDWVDVALLVVALGVVFGGFALTIAMYIKIF